MDKPVILFTNFWDANKLLDRKHFLLLNDDKLFKVQLSPNRYRVYSIALSHPSLSRLPNIQREFPNLERLNFFCPTYDMLKSHKEGGEWEEYVKDFHKLIKKRKEEIVTWVKSLIPNRAYILCCWENTSGKAHCHRELLYEAFSKSKSLKNRAVYIYRDGSWDDAYSNHKLYSYIDSIMNDHNSVPVPVMIGSEAIANELGVPLNSQIGTGMPNGGSWTVQMNLNSEAQNNLANIFDGLTTVSMSSSFQFYPDDNENF
jgi:hypothetical protein